MTDNGRQDDNPDEAWTKLHPIHQSRLQKAVQLLAETHGRRLSAGAQHVWCRALAPFAEGQRLWGAFRQACEGRGMPSIFEFKALLQLRPGSQMFESPPPLTPEQLRRSDQSAIMSMLWLVYTKGWIANDFEGGLFGRVFEPIAQREGATVGTFINAAREAFDEATVRRWMHDQEQAGN